MTGTVRAALAAATARLAAAGVPDAGRDARLLLAEALGLLPDRLTLVLAEPLVPELADGFARLVADRARRRPVAQILGRRAFWGREFEVTGDVLDPRPETETLIACALAGRAPARLLDLGTGSGAILVTLLAEWSQARGIGTDVSAPALAVAARNADRHGVACRTTLRCADWDAGVEGHFDLVVSNPPYIPAGDLERLAPEVRDWEPRRALTAGPTGLEAYPFLAAVLKRRLGPGGRALLEFGAGQGGAVAAIFGAEDFASVTLYSDLDGRDRVAAVVRRP